MRVLAAVLLLIATTAGQARADASPDTLAAPDPRVAAEPTWAVGVATRSATIPLNTDAGSVETYIPLIFYDGEGPFYFRGLETGLTFWKPGDWKFSAMGRMRFLDIPAEYQNEIRGDTVFWGLQGRYRVAGPWHLDLEALADFKGHEVYNARLGGQWERRRSWLKAYFQAQYKTPGFNTRYYGLDQEEAGGGVEFCVGASLMHTVASNFFIFVRGEAALLDESVRDISFVKNAATAQGFLGGGFKNDRTRTTPSVTKSRKYWRLAHGRVTPSSLEEILSFKAQPDADNHRMTSIFYGQPLSDTLIGLPIRVFLHAGLGWHWQNKKENIQELVLAVKLYYAIPLPVRLRLGFGHGWSWVSDIPYVEDGELRAKGYEPNPLMNHLDLSADLNLGDLFGWAGARETLDRLWIGYDIHHRSAVFETAQQFGRIKGGSNVQMAYVQFEY